QLPDLPDHGIRRHRAKEKRGTFNHGRSIEERPHKVETRQEFGHFEADTVLSGKRKGQAVATFVDKTLTVDHGKEFANYQTIERRTGTQVYFAHAYSPHERVSNENRNRVLRRFIPKGQAIEELSDHQLVQINWYLHSRPLKCLNWHTPISSLNSFKLFLAICHN
ncbi:IS30 family transposase, partial [Limosilactobacillus fermentum]|uniref:IS30 family transposase n=1 Tax=Limosilactobacillus fermentum TaxID=1613 RepID=UPI0022DEE902